jgi:AcrR family transcriptional regulator
VDARERLILAAEQLIGEHGVDVSLRDIALAAGQRNNSAVHYHFGSREGLLQAAVERRKEPLESARGALLAERGEPASVAEVLDVLITPMTTVPYDEGSTHYARFHQQVRNHPQLSRVVLGLEQWPVVRVLLTRLADAVQTRTGLSDADVRHRLNSMATAMFALLADAERAREQDRHPRPTQELVTMLEGLVTAVPG